MIHFHGFSNQIRKGVKNTPFYLPFPDSQFRGTILMILCKGYRTFRFGLPMNLREIMLLTLLFDCPKCSAISSSEASISRLLTKALYTDLICAGVHLL